MTDERHPASTEEKLARANRLLKMAGRIAHVGGWMVDLSTRRIEWSDEVCAIHDMPPGSSPTVQEGVNFYAPEYRARILQAFERCAREGQPFDEELELITAEGRRIWVRSIGEPVHDEGGIITHVQGAIQDITESKHAAAWSDQHFRRLADVIPEIIWTATPDGTLDYASRALYDFAGSSPEALPANEWPKIAHPDDVELAYQVWADSLAIGQAHRHQFRLRRRDGTYRWHVVSANPIRDGEGRITKWYGSAADIHDQKEAEEALRESETRFRQIAETIGEVFWMADPQTSEVLYVSPAFEDIWGRSPDDLYARPTLWYEMIHGGDRSRVIAALDRQADGGFNEEYRIVRPDGETRWIWDRAFPVRQEDGTVRRVVGVARDVTQRKRAQDALRASEERFQAIARASADVMWDRDLANETNWWSEQFEHLFGYPLEDARPDSWARHVHPQDRQRVLEGIDQALKGQAEFWHDEYRFVSRQDKLLDIEDRGCILRDDNGCAVRFIGGLTDITERRRAERELAERMKELRCLYRVLELTTDDSRSIAEIAEQVTALLPEGFVHSDVAVAKLVINDTVSQSRNWSEPVVGPLASAIVSDGENVGRVEVGYREDRVDEDGTTAAFLDEERALLGGVALHLGRLLTARRLQERIARSERMQALGELTGGIAHDFNNLLTVILGNAELLTERLSKDETLRPLAEMTENAAEKGSELTNRLLAFARRQPLDPVAVDANRLVAEMDELLRRTLGEEIELEVVQAGGLWPAHVDPAQLESAVLNLCINARDAMPRGGRLTIELGNVFLDDAYARGHEEVRPGQYIMVSVSDTGSGMAEEVAQRAFEPFFTTKHSSGGSGLGLSMVFGFIKQSGGHLKIYSEPDQGTTVKLYLPRAYETGKGAYQIRGDAPQGGTERILLVEDDQLVRSHVTAQLESLGYRVIGVTNAPEAVEALQQISEIDLLFTDVVMPGGMNGRELAEQAQLLRPGLPVLFTSGYTENAIVHHGRLDPGVHLLNKPYRRQELAAKVRAALREAGS